jgi:hypothetical protein
MSILIAAIAFGGTIENPVFLCCFLGCGTHFHSGRAADIGAARA